MHYLVFEKLKISHESRWLL